MIVIGADTHKQTHTCVAVDARTAQLEGELTAPARKPGFGAHLRWARALDRERIWAIEDCRHVSGSFERFLVACGEKVHRVPPKLMGQSRRAQRTRGKSDPIDALAVARAALKEGPEGLPVAHLDQEALDLKLLLDHREDIVRARAEDQQRLRWHLHDLWPEYEIPARALDRFVWLDRISRKLARAEQSTRVRIARELALEIRTRTRRATELEREITARIRRRSPQLLELEGCAALTAAKLIGETAGAARLASDAKFARLAGVAPIPASSGKKVRHRLDRGGNRQLNCALHRIAVTQGRVHPPAREFLAKKQAEGKSRIEALRCLKRHLARKVWKMLVESERERSVISVQPERDSLAPQFAGVA
jgi:transposase